MMKDEHVRYFVGEALRQWKYGEELLNPLVAFTKALKRGEYDEMEEDEIDQMHQAAISLSIGWQSKPEVSADELKGNLGHLLIQEIIIRTLGRTQTEDGDLRTVLEALSWERKKEEGRG